MGDCSAWGGWDVRAVPPWWGGSVDGSFTGVMARASESVSAGCASAGVRAWKAGACGGGRGFCQLSWSLESEMSLGIHSVWVHVTHWVHVTPCDSRYSSISLGSPSSSGPLGSWVLSLSLGPGYASIWLGSSSSSGSLGSWVSSLSLGPGYASIWLGSFSSA